MCRELLVLSLLLEISLHVPRDLEHVAHFFTIPKCHSVLLFLTNNSSQMLIMMPSVLHTYNNAMSNHQLVLFFTFLQLIQSDVEEIFYSNCLYIILFSYYLPRIIIDFTDASNISVGF